MAKRYFRPTVERMAGYTPGFQPKVADYIKLNTNENPYPPSPAVVKAIEKEIGRLAKYPDPTADRLREEVAKVFGVKIENVIAGNGSDDLLNIAIRAFVDPGQAVAFPDPTYSLYPVLAEIQDAKCAPVEWAKDWSLPEGLFASGAPLTILANPNSPTGTFVEPAQIAQLADSLDGVLVVDEAYADFARANCMELAKTRDNVIVFRTLSKSSSLAGLRVGYAVGSAALIAGLMKVKDSYNLDSLAIAGGAEAVRDQAHVKANAEKIKRTRARVVAELAKLGFHTLPSEANFIFTKPPSGIGGKAFLDELWKRLILVRWFSHPRVAGGVRVSIGSDAEMDKMLEAVRDILKGR